MPELLPIHTDLRATNEEMIERLLVTRTAKLVAALRLALPVLIYFGHRPVNLEQIRDATRAVEAALESEVRGADIQA